jgi:uncharacterized membrane protein YukC
VSTPVTEYLELAAEIDELDLEYEELEKSLKRTRSAKSREKINHELDRYTRELREAQEDLAVLKQRCHDEGYGVPMRPGADAPFHELMAEFAAEERAIAEESEIESDHEQGTDGGSQDK